MAARSRGMPSHWAAPSPFMAGASSGVLPGLCFIESHTGFPFLPVNGPSASFVLPHCLILGQKKDFFRAAGNFLISDPLLHDRCSRKQITGQKPSGRQKVRTACFRGQKRGAKRRGSHRPAEKCRKKGAAFLVKMLAFCGQSGYNKKRAVETRQIPREKHTGLCAVLLMQPVPLTGTKT